MQDYPKWLPVNGPGHPQKPGYVLVENEDQELEAMESGKGPAALNPPPDAGQKSLDEMDRDKLKHVLLSEGIPDDMSDDEIRTAIKHGRERRAQIADEDAKAAREEYEKRAAGGDHGDGEQTDAVPKADDDAPEDASGDKIAPDTADEANKAGVDSKRTLPGAKSAPGNDSRPDEAKDKVADDKPATSVVDAAATPASTKKGSK